MKNFPNAFVIIIGVVLFAWVLTFIIPQGSYQRITNTDTGITTVVSNSYQKMEGDHLSAFDVMLTIPNGVAGRADAIVLILLLGGCFFVIEKTGALSEGLYKIVNILQGREGLSLFIVSLLFTAAGVSIGMQEEVIAMMPVLLIFGKSMGFNTYTTLYMSYGSTVLGSAFSPSNPFGVIIAQQEAGVPLLSGSGYRLVVLGIAFLVWVIYLIRYNAKNRMKKVEASTPHEKISHNSKIILILLGLTFIIVMYGLLQLDWGFMEMSASFFTLGVVSGLLGKLGVNGTGEAYVNGFKEMIFAAMIIGLANSISMVLKEGMIIDSIVYGLFGPLQYLSASVSGVLMMVAHSILHFPIPSYSGQAILTMPILVPLSDLIGISRQTCVLAYQYGAIMGDMIVPTNGALMAILAICGIPYNKWFRFAWKPTLLMLLLGGIGIVVAIYIGYD
ncbi:YfcC family protein [Maribacter aurantiacus]|uniref:YfcC family protein n=1 Tax=Maribacter aurantiacus TaxID=1882343 RepID=A0A5R8LSW9_9FLAO|nr:Na+/H+ antiporter NhaC family protein [Maribacter aurantiacus]TLF40230.1 YfcC family protein [Maribacter aurantiacus]